MQSHFYLKWISLVVIRLLHHRCLIFMLDYFEFWFCIKKWMTKCWVLCCWLPIGCSLTLEVSFEVFVFVMFQISKFHCSKEIGAGICCLETTLDTLEVCFIWKVEFQAKQANWLRKSILCTRYCIIQILQLHYKRWNCCISFWRQGNLPHFGFTSFLSARLLLVFRVSAYRSAARVFRIAFMQLSIDVYWIVSTVQILINSYLHCYSEHCLRILLNAEWLLSLNVFCRFVHIFWLNSTNGICLL